MNTRHHRDRNRDRVVVIVPVYNHGRTVAGVVQEILGMGFPVIVVNDGATDDTSAALETISGIRVFAHADNQGKGAALLTGLRAAAGAYDWAVTLDADGQHAPRDIFALLSARPGKGPVIVVGQRTGMASAPWTSRAGRGFSNFWMRMSGAGRLTDSQSGFRLYPLPAVLELGVTARRYQYELEVLVKAAWQGIPLLEAPVTVDYAPMGQRVSHFNPWRDFLRNTATFSRLITHRVFTPRLWGRPRTRYRTHL